MKTITTFIPYASTILIFFLLTACTDIDASGSEQNESSNAVYEMRTYTTHEGKLDDLHKRFENHTIDFFEKHGMTNVAYWSPQSEELKENTLIYILKHESREAAEQSWQDFREDPEWQKAYEESHADGPIVQHIESVYMTRTPYSPE
ncbi:hypothetical protein BH23BAC3_BH23BAC3_29990 [soil metagenome]